MPHPPPAARFLFARARVAASAGAAGLLAAWSVGQLARDVVWATGLCFYIPSVVVAVSLAAVAALHAVARRRR